MQDAPVLVVDDQPPMAGALAALVRHFGYEVTVLHDGGAAVDYVRTHPTKLLVLDLQMPGFSGFDVLRELRQDAGPDRPPVVVCSAVSTPTVRDEAMRLGAEEFVAKDAAFERLEGAISRLVGPGDAKVS